MRGAFQYSLVIEEVGDDPVGVASRGQTEKGLVELGTDTYTFCCSVPGRRGDWMEGIRTVAH